MTTTNGSMIDMMNLNKVQSHIMRLSTIMALISGTQRSRAEWNEMDMTTAGEGEEVEEGEGVMDLQEEGGKWFQPSPINENLYKK